MGMPRSVVYGLLMLLAVSSPAFAGTAGGVIAQDTTWGPADSPVTIIADLTVPEGVGLTIEDGVTVELEANRRLSVAGSLAAGGAAVNFGLRSAIEVAGAASFTNCALDGLAGPSDAESVTFTALAGGGFVDCAIENLKVVLETNAVSIAGGQMNNANGASLYLNLTEGAAPMVSGVDFSADPDWLNVGNMDWFLAELDASLLTNFSGNTYPATASLSIGAGTIAADFTFAAQLPFSGATAYSWNWSGGAIAAGAAVTLDPDVALDITYNVTIDGDFTVMSDAVLTTNRAVTLTGALTIQPGGVWAFSGASPSASIAGTLTLESGAEAWLAGVCSVSGALSMGENTILTLNTLAVEAGGLMTAGPGADIGMNYAGLTVNGTLEADQASFRFLQDAALTIGGVFTGSSCWFAFTPSSDLIVNSGAVFTATGSVFDGAHEAANQDDIRLLQNAAATLSGCDIRNVNVVVGSSNVTIQNGFLSNADGPALHLRLTSGQPPMIGGIDFNNDADWLLIGDMPWFLSQLAALPGRLGSNVVPAVAKIVLDNTNFDRDYTLPAVLPFTGDAQYTWQWTGGAVLAGSTLTVPAGSQLEVTGPLTISGELDVRSGAYVETKGSVSVPGVVHVAGSGTKALTPQLVFRAPASGAGQVKIDQAGVLEAGTFNISAGGQLRIEDGSQINIRNEGLAVYGTLLAADSTIKFLETAYLRIYGAGTLSRSLVDIYVYNDVEVYGTLSADHVVFDGVRDSREPDSVAVFAGGEASFTWCDFQDILVNLSGQGSFDLSTFTNPDGDGIVVKGDGAAEVSRCHLLNFKGDALRNEGQGEVTASYCYWGAADGPSGEGFTGSGQRVSGDVTVDAPLSEPLEFHSPSIAGHEPGRYIIASFDHVDLTFSGMIDARTFDRSDINFIGPNGIIGIGSVTPLEGYSWRVAFAAQTVPGDYFFEAGPEIANVAGFALDQDGDGLGGEPYDDVYQARFSLGNAPAAGFSYSQTGICAGNSVAFEDTSSNEPVEWLWNFGDNTTASAQTVSHAFAAPGVYTVSLTVKNAFGQDTITRANLIQAGAPPVAAFTASVQNGNAPLTVQFTNQSQGEEVSYSWDFKDGSQSSETSPSHTFLSGGTYAVTLTAQNGCGNDAATLPQAISVVVVNAPAAPTGLNATDGASCDRIDITWQPSLNTDYYTLYRGGAVRADNLTTAAFTDITATPGVIYQYAVTASNGVGASPMSTPDNGYREAVSPPPSGVTATDGDLSDMVRVSWSPVSGAQSYQVYRSVTDDPATAAPVSPLLILTAYDDTDTAFPELVPGKGCFGEDTIVYTYYYYWVKTQSRCGESALSLSDRGHRGSAANAARKLRQAILPSAHPVPGADGAPVFQTLPGDELALRLTAADDAAIDPASVWGQAAWNGGSSDAVRWVPVDPRDGWVVFTPDTPWAAGTEVVMTAGGAAADGTPLTETQAVFRAVEAFSPETPLVQPDYGAFDASALDPGKEDNREIALSVSRQSPMRAGIGPVYDGAPERVFDTPQRVWLPLPEGDDPAGVTLYIYLASGEQIGWFPAERVAGWMSPGSEMTLTLGGVTYWGAVIRHGAVMQLGPIPADTPAVAANVVPWPLGSLGDLAALGLAGAVMAAASRRRKSRGGARA